MKSDEEIEKELSVLVEEKGGPAAKCFEKDIISGIQDQKLLKILEDVKKLAKDIFRPALMSLSCESVGGNPDDTVTASLMISLAGAGIGIHDDIVDKSTTKGFKKTILGLYDANDALLVGDLLIVKGLTAVQEIVRQGYSSQKVADIINVFQKYYFEICEGVFMEESWRKKNVETELDFCHHVLWKFASDGEACTRLGAMLGNGTEKEIQALSGFGRRMCYVFRLTDEVKDSLNLNGSLIRRLKFESVPLPLLYAAKVSKEHYANLKSILEEPINSSEIKTLVDICFETEAFDYVYGVAQKNMEEGIKMLRILKPSKARTALTEMMRQMFPSKLVQLWQPTA